ncbi:MAG: hypothetical protein GF384_04460, partial [Elusimicrobia bacterium]|nr:hypothetical protein [Elusimicrobiota bacterium]MBD3412101.1 hypothetical protein [Elusimicrobiota bacterium]
MKNKIIFIETAGSVANVFENQMKLPLLGTLYLGTILHNAGHTVTILNENFLAKKIHPIELHADYVCLSSLTLNANRTIELAKGVKKFYPHTKVIIGGIHASLLPD